MKWSVCAIPPWVNKHHVQRHLSERYHPGYFGQASEDLVRDLLGKQFRSQAVTKGRNWSTSILITGGNQHKAPKNNMNAIDRLPVNMFIAGRLLPGRDMVAKVFYDTTLCWCW